MLLSIRHMMTNLNPPWRGSTSILILRGIKPLHVFITSLVVVPSTHPPGQGLERRAPVVGKVRSGRMIDSQRPKCARWEHAKPVVIEKQRYTKLVFPLANPPANQFRSVTKVFPAGPASTTTRETWSSTHVEVSTSTTLRIKSFSAVIYFPKITAYLEHAFTETAQRSPYILKLDSGRLSPGQLNCSFLRMERIIQLSCDTPTWSIFGGVQ